MLMLDWGFALWRSESSPPLAYRSGSGGGRVPTSPPRHWRIRELRLAIVTSGGDVFPRGWRRPLRSQWVGTKTLKPLPGSATWKANCSTTRK
jgi:hypothetical protein